MTVNGPGGTDDKKVDLVFEGGGVKGIALVGAYSVLAEEGYAPQNVRSYLERTAARGTPTTRRYRQAMLELLPSSVNRVA